MEMISILIIPQPVREVKRNRSRYSDGISEKRPKTTNFFAFKGDSGCLLARRDERFYAWRGAKNPYLRHYRVIPMARITTGRVEFFVRRYKNLQAVAELQARIFVKYDGKGASECVNRELRGDVLSPAGTFSLSGLAFLVGICYNRKWFYGKSRFIRSHRKASFNRHGTTHVSFRPNHQLT